MVWYCLRLGQFQKEALNMPCETVTVEPAGGGDPCADISCPDGMVCESGECVESPNTDPCADVTCDSGFVCEGGECVEVEVPEAPIDRGTMFLLAAAAIGAWGLSTRGD